MFIFLIKQKKGDKIIYCSQNYDFLFNLPDRKLVCYATYPDGFDFFFFEITHACSLLLKNFKKKKSKSKMVSQRLSAVLFQYFSFLFKPCVDKIFLKNMHFLNKQKFYLVWNQLHCKSLNRTHILPCLCNPKIPTTMIQ